MALDALDVLLLWPASVGADTRWLRGDRGWTILALMADKRYAEAIDHLRVLGHRADGPPWSMVPKPAQFFLEARVEACKAVPAP